MRSKYVLIVLSIVAAIVATAVVASAGDPDNPPGPPETTSSYTLEHIYDRLSSGAAGTPITFTEPISGPGSGTMHTLGEIMAIAPQVDDTNGATVTQVMSGTTYWGLRDGAWGLQTGTMPDNEAVIITPTVTSQTIAVGYHDGNGYVVGDTDLVAGNIGNGVDIFGVTGSLQGCDGTNPAGANCNCTCDCQSGLVCVRLSPHLTSIDNVQECVLTLYPPPGLPVEAKKCFDWSALTAAISADSQCIDAFQDGLNPYEYITPLH
jgi:hypothetical protein